MDFSEGEKVQLSKTPTIYRFCWVIAGEVIRRKIRMTQSAKKLLNIVHDNRLSIDKSNAITIYFMLTKLWKNNQTSGIKLGKYQLMSLKDPRYTDRRMQSLIRMLVGFMGDMTGAEKVLVLWITVKLR